MPDIMMLFFNHFSQPFKSVLNDLQGKEPEAKRLLHNSSPYVSRHFMSYF